MLTWVSTAQHHSFKHADLGEKAEGRECYYKLKNKVIQISSWLPQLSTDKVVAIGKMFEAVNMLNFIYLRISSSKGKDIKNLY